MDVFYSILQVAHFQQTVVQTDSQTAYPVGPCLTVAKTISLNSEHNWKQLLSSGRGASYSPVKLIMKATPQVTSGSCELYVQ